MHDKMIKCTRLLYMEKEFSFQDISNSNFEAILHKHITYLTRICFQVWLKMGFWLSFIFWFYMYVVLSISSCLTHLNEMLLIMRVFVSLRWESPNYTWWGLACLRPFAYCLGKQKTFFFTM